MDLATLRSLCARLGLDYPLDYMERHEVTYLDAHARLHGGRRDNIDWDDCYRGSGRTTQRLLETVWLATEHPAVPTVFVAGTDACAAVATERLAVWLDLLDMPPEAVRVVTRRGFNDLVRQDPVGAARWHIRYDHHQPVGV